MNAQMYELKLSGQNESKNNELAEFLLAYEKFVKKYGKRYVDGTLAHLQNELRDELTEPEPWRPVY